MNVRRALRIIIIVVCRWRKKMLTKKAHRRQLLLLAMAFFPLSAFCPRSCACAFMCLYRSGISPSNDSTFISSGTACSTKAVLRLCMREHRCPTMTILWAHSVSMKINCVHISAAIKKHLFSRFSSAASLFCSHSRNENETHCVMRVYVTSPLESIQRQIIP